MLIIANNQLNSSCSATETRCDGVIAQSIRKHMHSLALSLKAYTIYAFIGWGNMVGAVKVSKVCRVSDKGRQRYPLGNLGSKQ